MWFFFAFLIILFSLFFSFVNLVVLLAKMLLYCIDSEYFVKSTPVTPLH